MVFDLSEKCALYTRSVKREDEKDKSRFKRVLSKMQERIHFSSMKRLLVHSAYVPAFRRNKIFAGSDGTPGSVRNGRCMHDASDVGIAVYNLAAASDANGWQISVYFRRQHVPSMVR